MFICSGKLDYQSGKIVAALGDAEYAALRSYVTSDLKKKMPENKAEFKPDDFHGWNEHVMDDEEVGAFTRAGVEVQIKTIRGLSRGHTGGTRDPIQHVTQISLANVGLLEVCQVTYEEDCCTDLLQDRLNEGWRILCVCPPKDSRRPTYILGRKE
jgi:hypothetical protein